MEDEYLSVEEIAHFLQCTDRTVRNLIHRCELGAYLENGKWRVSLKTAQAHLLVTSITFRRRDI